MAKVPVVDPDLCTGCGICSETCPDVFSLEGDIAVVTDPNGASEEEIQEAIDNCPVEAISWEEE
ncbi:MAG: ferredoxin [Candidatus Latescibacteria bacterium 4484_7]|nr:MAG: ferredoxin [Candidatus Latescibacteria bacterium 4484_7]RKZ05461.1 MAG: ferredoxin [bacterium]